MDNSGKVLPTKANDPYGAKMSEVKLDVLREVRGSTLSSQIVSQIKNAVFRGEFKSGDALGSEADIAAQFGVSRMSVRDAMRTLEAIGLIEIKVGFGGGARIASGSLTRFTEALAVQVVLLNLAQEDVLQAQAAIEIAAAGLAAINATPKHLEEMEGLLELAERHADDPVKVADFGHRFHLAVAEASGNPILVLQLEAFKHVMWPPGSSRTTKKVGGHVLEVHRSILDAIASRDAAKARHEMAQHVAMFLKKTENAKMSESDIHACFS